MGMSEDKLEQIVTNEKEWRKLLYKKIESMEEDQKQFKKDYFITITTLKVKHGILSAFFGVIGGSIATLLVFLKK